MTSTTKHTGMHFRAVLMVVLVLLSVRVSSRAGSLYQGLPGYNVSDLAPVLVTVLEPQTVVQTETDIQKSGATEVVLQTSDSVSATEDGVRQVARQLELKSDTHARYDKLTRLMKADLKPQRLTKPVKNNDWENYQWATENIDKAANTLAQISGQNPDEPGLARAKQKPAEMEQQRQEVEAIVRQLPRTMVLIPGGTFYMGDLSDKGLENEKPVHFVTVPSFKLGKYEVTFAQWDACVRDGGCDGYHPDDKGRGRGNMPVINVSWDDAQLFIIWLNYKTGGNFRLPTEAEWEYAARGGGTTYFNWGDSIGQNRANCWGDLCGEAWEYAAPVGSFSVNIWGLHDMHGNVSEWGHDCWNKSYVGAPINGSAWESGYCDVRVIRGGSWLAYPFGLRSARRDNMHRSHRVSTLTGFRLAQDP